jgi:hypothetical protein
VYLHVAAANYNIPHTYGVAPPPGFQLKEFNRSTTDRAKVIQTLKDSFANTRKAVLRMSVSHLEKKLDWFVGNDSYLGVKLFMTSHVAEYLGQSIADIRRNGVVPPSTGDLQTQPKAQETPKP